MLPSVRKDLEEIEVRLDTVLNKQVELENLVREMSAQITQGMQGQTERIIGDVANDFELQSRWVASTLLHLRGEVMEQGTLEKTEIIAAMFARSDAQQRRVADLEAQLQTWGETLQAYDEKLSGRLDGFEAAWRDRVESEIDDISAQSVKEWSEKIGMRLKKFGDSEGMPRSFALQLSREIEELSVLNSQFDDDAIEWRDRLDDLQRILFAAELSMPWTCLTPHNSTPEQRRELRILETATAQLRSYEQERLLQVTGIKPLEIVPFATQFEARIHESDEFLELPTAEANEHNLIHSVDQAGFQQISPWGETKLLRPARVRRYVLQHQEMLAPIDVEDEHEPIDIVDMEDQNAPLEAAEVEEKESPIDPNMPRVSGQL